MSDNKQIIATEIFQKLLVDGVINRDKDDKTLFDYYYDTEVKCHLDIMASVMEFETFVQNNKIYMFAKTSSEFSQTNADMREKIRGCNNKNSRLYLSQIIFIVFLSEMFGGTNSMRLKREFIPIEEFAISIQNIFESVDKKEDIDEETNMNFLAAKKEWDGLLIEPLDTKSGPKSNDRIGFIQNAMNFFYNEGLVEKNNEIGNILFYPTTKLKDFISAGKFDEERFKNILIPLEDM